MKKLAIAAALAMSIVAPTSFAALGDVTTTAPFSATGVVTAVRSGATAYLTFGGVEYQVVGLFIKTNGVTVPTAQQMGLVGKTCTFSGIVRNTTNTTFKTNTNFYGVTTAACQ